MTSEILNELYENRLLVFLETSPQSNEYFQVYLNEKQFKSISDAIAEEITTEETRDGYEGCKVKVSEDKYTLPDLQSINEDIYEL